MWKEFFSSIGIDSVKVDTVLEKQIAAPGETVKGNILIKGGQADEPVEKIQVLLYMQYEEVKEDSDFSWHDKDIEEINIQINRNIAAGESETIPFLIKIPDNGPLTDGSHKWYIKTKVFIDQAVDPEDEDQIIVQ
ncbi:sporulation protein [Domibacillus indicus]|uniref:sporulation protein n=1 Tax=Domibacillus indicus TaxID=1437523 RepID=UPI000617B797|nr:sporulation protein [Domibacillus indicus]